MYNSQDSTILFFDGLCPLCDGVVTFLIKNDPQHKFRFASLQGETAKQYCTQDDISSLSTVILWHNGKIYRKSEALVEIFRILNCCPIILYTLSHLPAVLSDFFYEIISKNRYFLFGKNDSCRLPNEAENLYFLP